MPILLAYIQYGACAGSCRNIASSNTAHPQATTRKLGSSSNVYFGSRRVWRRKPLGRAAYADCGGGRSPTEQQQAAEIVQQEQQPPPPPRPLFNYKVGLSYDGTNYAGFQLQLGARGKPTIQGRFEAALCKLTGEPREVLKVQGAGRTDAGVHARGQVAQFVTTAPIHCGVALKALNSMLPHDLFVTGVQRVPLDFNVRYSLRKTYLYDIHTQPVGDPFTIRFRHHPRHAESLNLDAIGSAAQLFVGTHDFRNFSNVLRDGSNRTNPVKTIHRFEVVGIEGGIRLVVEGKGFLYKQVRHMAGALLAVGAGRLDPGRIQELLEAGSVGEGPSGRPGYRGWNVAEAKGLCLHSVVYPPHDDPEKPMALQQEQSIESDQD